MSTALDDTLGKLASAVAPLAPDAPTLLAYEAFSADPTLYAIAVVDSDGTPRGLLNRFKFLEALSRPFGRDLLHHQRVTATMDAAPLVVDEHVPLDQLSSIVVNDSTKYVFDGFIVTREGRYLGIGTGYSLIRCLTERKEAALFHLAHHDALTGLPNRQLFNDRLGQTLARCQRGGQHLALLFIDVDRFKAVNDSLGHAVGDLLLKSIASRLAENIRAQDTVARLSGDEFAIILTDCSTEADAELVARMLLGCLRESHVIEGRDINVSCSIGVAVFPTDAMTAAGLLRAADDATYHAKQLRNTWQRFSADIDRTQSGTLLAFASIQRALADSHLEVVYQPQIDARSQALSGVEALVRWRDPVHGLMPTSEFIRLAEDAGLIGAVTDYVLDTAMRQVIDWTAAGLVRGLTLAVNVSGIELGSGTLVPMIERRLHEHGFSARSLELEITESTVMRSRASADVMARLKSMGVRLSIDDFGTGYSSLSRLHRLPIDALKIDRSFVEGLKEDESGAMVQAIILMAHSLGLTVTGEGVETEAQLEFLRVQGCDRLQGYFISRPLTEKALAARLQRASAGDAFAWTHPAHLTA